VVDDILYRSAQTLVQESCHDTAESVLDDVEWDDRQEDECQRIRYIRIDRRTHRDEIFHLGTHHFGIERKDKIHVADHRSDRHEDRIYDQGDTCGLFVFIVFVEKCCRHDIDKAQNQR